jgi:hypothetical protein
VRASKHAAEASIHAENACQLHDEAKHDLGLKHERLSQMHSLAAIALTLTQNGTADNIKLEAYGDTSGQI